MAYCTATDVAAHNARRNGNGGYGAGTVPTLDQVNSIIAMISGQIDSALAVWRVATPVTAPASFLAYLQNVNALGAAAQADMAAFPEGDGGAGSSSHGERLWAMFLDALDDIRLGETIDPNAVEGTDPLARTYLTDNPDNDWASDGSADGQNPAFAMSAQNKDF